jgi:hypothetical protein
MQIMQNEQILRLAISVILWVNQRAYISPLARSFKKNTGLTLLLQSYVQGLSCCGL